jgi:hypothetical protein
MCATFDIQPVPGEWGDMKLDPHWGKVFIPSQWKLRRAALDTTGV